MRLVRALIAVVMLVASTVTAPTLAQQAPAFDAAAHKTGQFKRDPVRAKQNLARYLDLQSKTDPAGAAANRKTLAAMDMFALMATALKASGLDSENLYDVTALMWILTWQGANGIDGDPDRATVLAVRNQVVSVSIKFPAFAKSSNEEKQDFADEMIIKLVFFDAAAEGAKARGAQGRAEVRAVAIDMAKSYLGADITQATIDQRGITRKDATPSATSTPRPTTVARANTPPGVFGYPTAAELKAAHAALPPALKSAKIVDREYYNSYNSYSLEQWMLFPGGLAAQCDEVDVARIQPSKAWFKAQKCETGTWRTGGKGFQLQRDGDGDWQNVIANPPQPAGKVFDAKLRSSSGGSINGGAEGVTTSVMSSGTFQISSDGWLFTDMQTSVSASGNGLFAGNTDPGRGMKMRYAINGMIITLGFPDGHIEHRYAVFEMEKGLLEYAYMNDIVYFRD